MIKIIATHHAVDRARQRGALADEDRLTLSAEAVKRKLVMLWQTAQHEMQELYLDRDAPEIPTIVQPTQTRDGEIFLVARPNLKTREIVIVSVLTPDQKLNNTRRRWKPWPARAAA